MDERSAKIICKHGAGKLTQTRRMFAKGGNAALDERLRFRKFPSSIHYFAGKASLEG